KATLSLEEEINGIQLDAADVKRNSVTSDQESKDLARAYVKGGLRILKLYGPTLAVGSASVICVISAQGIMHSRNAALAVAYTALEKGFNEYRKRVADHIGEE